MTTPSNYWNRDQVRRRTVIRGGATGAVGLAALGLVGCGGGDDNGGGGASTGGAAVVDSTQGKPGGSFKLGQSGYPTGFNPITSSTTIYTTAGLSYSGLLAHKWGQESVGIFDYYDLEPDVASALPEQPDDTTLIFKLRPNVKFHNGRTMTAEDVAYTFDRLANNDRSLWRSKYRTWMERVETPDATTVRVKTKFPYADALTSMAANTDGFIVAKEHEEGPDADTKFMGTGPFIFVNAVPPVSITYRKNPDYFLKPYPYFDEVIALGYSDPVKRLTDFVTGQIHIPWLVYADERDEIKQRRPDAVHQGWTSWANSLFLRTDKPPFNDKRVRQGLSMAIDRKKIRELATKGEGREDQWFPLMYKDIFGFREVKELGAAAKYWDYNPGEAKRLLAAAGITSPIETELHHYPAVIIGQFFVDTATLTEAQWKEQGIANVRDIEEQPARFQQTNRGEYDGLAISITSGFNSGAPSFALTVKDHFTYLPERSPTNVSHYNNPQIYALADKQTRQLKLEDRKATYREMEPILAEEQHRIMYSTTTQNYLWDPKLKNARMSPEQGSRRFHMRWWFA